jgi:hypothetical protein
MALSPNFALSQTFGLESTITLQDTSTGSDPAIVTRRIYFRKDNNTFLVPEGSSTEYVTWPYASSSISVDVLDKDRALDVVLQWLDNSSTVLYDKTILSGFTLFNETYDYQLSQMLSGNPLLINDNCFFERKSQLRTAIDSGNQALELAADIFGAQQCYDYATNIRLNYDFSA